MSTDVATQQQVAAATPGAPQVPAVVSPLPTRALAAPEFSDAQLQIIRANGGSALDPDEFEAFMYVARRTGLDPLARQIYAVKRKDTKLGRMVMTIQTGIDGYRLIADRTGRYAPSERAPELQFNGDQIVAATVWVKKLTDDGTWHEVPGTAVYAEFVQKKDGEPTKFWATMPVNQLCKCAEAQAIRRAFPADTVNVWTTETAPRAEFDVEVEATEVRRPIAAPKAKSAATLPPPKPVERTLGEDERRFVVTPAKTLEKETKAKKAFWVLKAQSGEEFTAWRKDHVAAFRVAMDRGWQAEVIEKKNGQYWNVERVTPIEPPPAADAKTDGPEPVPPGDDVLAGASPESRALFPE